MRFWPNINYTYEKDLFSFGHYRHPAIRRYDDHIRGLGIISVKWLEDN